MSKFQLYVSAVILMSIGVSLMGVSSVPFWQAGIGVLLIITGSELWNIARDR
jgi:hypothetical protein